MCLTKGFVGGVACAFGLGVLLTSFLPCGAIIAVQGVAIVSAGVLLFGR